jgi:predicted nuclease of predicted toxin-antitoxin system
MEFYADEDFPLGAVEELRRLGHDVLTAQDDGYRHKEDKEVLARAHALNRIVLTHNRRHFERLDREGQPHSGILSATQDPHKEVELAIRIHEKVAGLTPGQWCAKVNRPST